MADITDSSFQQDVLKSETPVLVDFWAPWCGPCKVVGPVVDALEKEYAGKIKVGKMNVDDNPQVSGDLGVMSIPTLMLFKNGEVKWRQSGVVPTEYLRRVVEENQ